MSGSESQLVRLTRSELYQAFPSQERVSSAFTPLQEMSGHQPQSFAPLQERQTQSISIGRGPAPHFNLNLNQDQSNFQWKQGPVLQVSSSSRRGHILAQVQSQGANVEGSIELPEIGREQSNSSFRVAEISTPHFKMTPTLLSKASEEGLVSKEKQTSTIANQQENEQPVAGQADLLKQVAQAISRPERGFNHSPNSPFILARSLSFKAKGNPKHHSEKLITRSVYYQASREKLNKIQPEQGSRLQSLPNEEQGKASTSSEAVQSDSEVFVTPMGKRDPYELDEQQGNYIRTTATRKGESNEEPHPEEQKFPEDDDEIGVVAPQELCFESLLSEDASMEGNIRSIPEESDLGKWEHFPSTGNNPSGWFYCDPQTGFYYSRKELVAYQKWAGENTGQVWEGSHIHGLGELQITKFKSREKERGAQYKPKRKYRKKIHGNNPAYSKGRLLTPEERQARLNKMIEKTHMIGTYICKVCGKIFKTGQGLGGHMSKMHYGVSDFLKKNRLTQANRKKKRGYYQSDGSYTLET